jgi:hypothetical protein
MSTPIVDEYLTIRTLDLGTRAHMRRSMGPVWSPPGRRGGRPRIVASETGALPRPVVGSYIRFILEVWVDGRFTVNNTVNTDPQQGWDTNLAALEAACEPEPDSPWTIPATHTFSWGSRTADIQVVDLVVPSRLAGVAAWVGVDIVIPSGSWDGGS